MDIHPYVSSPPEVAPAPLVLPRSDSKKHKVLGGHLDVICRNTEEAVHAGYCKRKVKKMDAALGNIITAATAARNLLRESKL